MSDNKNSNEMGIITEQGYPMGQFGFKPLNEDEKKRIEDSNKKDDNKGE